MLDHVAAMRKDEATKPVTTNTTKPAAMAAMARPLSLLFVSLLSAGVGSRLMRFFLEHHDACRAFSDDAANSSG